MINEKSPIFNAPLSEEEIERNKKIATEKNGVYVDEYNDLGIREIIISYFEDTEQLVNKFTNKEINGKELSDQLGDLIMKPSVPSAQIYAFENLLKSLSEAEKKEDIESIVNEIIFDVSTNFDASMKEYYMGLLAHYVGKYNIKKLETEISIEGKDSLEETGKKERLDIFKKFFQAIDFSDEKNLNKDLKDMNDQYQPAKEIIDIIKNNFSEESEKGSIARLIGKYYEMGLRGGEKDQDEYKEKKGDKIDLAKSAVWRNKEHRDVFIKKLEELLEDYSAQEAFFRSPTRYPSLEESDPEDEIIRRPGEKRDIEKTNVPRKVVKIGSRNGRIGIPSEEKLLQSLEHDMHLGVILVKEVDGQVVKEEIDEMIMPVVRDFLSNARRLKDERRFGELTALEEEFKRACLESLDLEARRGFNGVEGIDITAFTVRNYSEEELRRRNEQRQNS